ncbi:hypothetical protein B0H17DRAFT_1124865 [Mycena rosella]|uniref:Secreted protein n=1 Tax=Mycena rosella TaxID=1033263 RepID=A0AAD7MAQ3_MYCRO|nr:hypothetical protein B0H17DRAFT_1124865 [Mycena rosella]
MYHWGLRLSLAVVDGGWAAVNFWCWAESTTGNSVWGAAPRVGLSKNQASEVARPRPAMADVVGPELPVARPRLAKPEVWGWGGSPVSPSTFSSAFHGLGANGCGEEQCFKTADG